MPHWLGSVMGELKSVEELFKGRHFDREIINLCVRGYLRFNLSLRDLVEMMTERGLAMAHTTIVRWVQRNAPDFERRGAASADRWAGPGGSTRPTRRSEASGYLYRAIDRAGKTGYDPRST
jgi:transposase-like protein